jgi:hypothetical protein
LGYSEHATQMVLSAHLSFLQGCVYHFKVTGSYHPSTREIFSDMKRLLEVYQAQSFRLYKIFLIIALPLGAVQRLRKLYRSVRVCAQSLARGSDCCDVESS